MNSFRLWFVWLMMVLLLVACGPHTRDHEMQAITAIPTTLPGTAAVTPTPAGYALFNPPANPYACTDAEIADLLRAVPAYTPGNGAFVAVRGADLSLNWERFVLRGVNYQPEGGLFGIPLDVLERDFARLHAIGINAVRVFVDYGPLFTCSGHGAIPDPAAVAHFDALIRLADTYDLRLIPVLHHTAGQAYEPLYTHPGDMPAQTAYIVTRYRAEPVIALWDLRDSGDADYDLAQGGRFTREGVLDWLSRTAAAVHQIDPHHPVTAGWAADTAGTFASVDVVSMQHFDTTQALRERVAGLRAQTDKPVLLVAFGASSLTPESPAAREERQAQVIADFVRAGEADQLAGWFVWTMLDAPLDPTCAVVACDGAGDPRGYFGLWRMDRTPKAAVALLDDLIPDP